MFKDLRGRMDDFSENLNKNTVGIKKDIRNHKKEPVRNEEYNI